MRWKARTGATGRTAARRPQSRGRRSRCSAAMHKVRRAGQDETIRVPTRSSGVGGKGPARGGCGGVGWVTTRSFLCESEAGVTRWKTKHGHCEVCAPSLRDSVTVRSTGQARGPRAVRSLPRQRARSRGADLALAAAGRCAHGARATRGALCRQLVPALMPKSARDTWRRASRDGPARGSRRTRTSYTF